MRLPARSSVWVTFALLVVGVTVVVLARVRAVGREALAQAESALAAGDSGTSVFFATRAAEARCPVCDAPEAAFRRLESIADGAETRGELPLALAAWRSVRTAIVASHAEWTQRARLAKADLALVRVASRACEASDVRAPGQCADNVEHALEQDPLPPLSAYVFLSLGLAGLALALSAVPMLR